jgi:Zn-dependent M28 family amino/carboxypeptidase
LQSISPVKIPRIRFRAVASAVGAILLIVALVLIWMTSVPGQSFAGALPTPAPALRATLERDVVELAQTIGERNVYRRTSLARARDFIATRMRDSGLQPKLETYSVPTCACSNIAADIPGTTRAHEVIVIGAHYDSVTGSPGANDNATGVAAMLALAENAAKTPHARTLRFIAFVNEEPPFFQTDQMGSRVNAHASHARGDDIVAMLSLETLGCYSDEPGTQSYPSPLLRLIYPSRGNFVTFVSNLGSRPLLRHVVETFRDHARIPSEGGALPEWVSGVGWSDHESYWREGRPAIMVTDTAIFRDANYHRRTDAVEHVDFERLALVVEGLEHVVADLGGPAPAPSPPKPLR